MRRTSRRHYVAILAVALAIVILLAILRFAEGGSLRNVEIDRDRGEVRFSAVVEPGAMARPFGVQGHHAIVWENGGSSRMALFRAKATDLEVRAALESLGARAGENLTEQTWTERENTTNPAADERVEGAPIEVFVSWKGKDRVPLGALLLLHKSRPPRDHFDFRYGGNERFRDAFKSGCIVCLYSCPGGSIGNRTSTIRDFVRDGVVYTANEDELPKAGTPVIITLRMSSRS
ncbi:MAG TPA: YdjY domain-containing protein [Thermoanaerobaculia bacterium]